MNRRVCKPLHLSVGPTGALCSISGYVDNNNPSTTRLHHAIQFLLADSGPLSVGYYMSPTDARSVAAALVEAADAVDAALDANVPGGAAGASR